MGWAWSGKRWDWRRRVNGGKSQELLDEFQGSFNHYLHFLFLKIHEKNEILEIEQTWISTNPTYFIHKKAKTPGSQSRMRASMLRWWDWNSSHMYDMFHQLFHYHRSTWRGLWTSRKTSVASMPQSLPGCVILSKILVLALTFTSTGWRDGIANVRSSSKTPPFQYYSLFCHVGKRLTSPGRTYSYNSAWL